MRLISLAKAAEMMDMGKEQFLDILDNYGYEFSFLDKSDIEIERKVYGQPLRVAHHVARMGLFNNFFTSSGRGQ